MEIFESIDDNIKNFGPTEINELNDILIRLVNSKKNKLEEKYNITINLPYSLNKLEQKGDFADIFKKLDRKIKEEKSVGVYVPANSVISVPMQVPFQAPLFNPIIGLPNKNLQGQIDNKIFENKFNGNANLYDRLKESLVIISDIKSQMESNINKANMDTTYFSFNSVTANNEYDNEYDDDKNNKILKVKELLSKLLDSDIPLDKTFGDDLPFPNIKKQPQYYNWN
jgi:hypothetical protein